MAALIENRPSFSATKVWMVREGRVGAHRRGVGDISGPVELHSRLSRLAE